MILRRSMPWLPLPVFAPDDEGGDGGDKNDAAGDSADKDDAGADKADAGDKSDTDDKAGAGEADKGAADDKADKGDKAAGSDIPENWRELAAAGDEDLLKELKRYGSLKNVAKALKDAKATIRSGVKEPPQPDGTDEKAMAEWRKAKGIPDDPTGYKLPEEVTKRMSDEDKPLIAAFTEYAHAKNARPDVVEIASSWYFDMTEKLDADRIAADKEASESAEESLRTTWGNAEYKGNLTLAQRYMESVPGLGEKWSEFRGPDGKRLGDSPEFIEFMSDMGREKFGDVTFANSDSTSHHNNRKAEIEKAMNTDGGREYWKSPAMQEEYRKILEREAKRK